MASRYPIAGICAAVILFWGVIMPLFALQKLSSQNVASGAGMGLGVLFVSCVGLLYKPNRPMAFGLSALGMSAISALPMLHLV